MFARLFDFGGYKPDLCDLVDFAAETGIPLDEAEELLRESLSDDWYGE